MHKKAVFKGVIPTMEGIKDQGDCIIFDVDDIEAVSEEWHESYNMGRETYRCISTKGGNEFSVKDDIDDILDKIKRAKAARAP